MNDAVQSGGVLSVSLRLVDHWQKARRHSASPPALSQLTASSFDIAASSAPLLLRLITFESRQESRLKSSLMQYQPEKFGLEGLANDARVIYGGGPAARAALSTLAPVAARRPSTWKSFWTSFIPSSPARCSGARGTSPSSRCRRQRQHGRGRSAGAPLPASLQRGPPARRSDFDRNSGADFQHRLGAGLVFQEIAAGASPTASTPIGKRGGVAGGVSGPSGHANETDGTGVVETLIQATAHGAAGYEPRPSKSK